MPKTLLLVFTLLLSLFVFEVSSAPSPAALCHGKFVDPITDVCWGCLFPITIGSAPVVPGDEPDTKNPSVPVCTCPVGVLWRVGITLGYWEPTALVDVTRTPFCMVNLGGLELDMGNYGAGKTDEGDPSDDSSMYYVHWYIFPLMKWLNLITSVACLETGDFDIAYLTELDPTWHDDELAFILNPEDVLFANLVSQMACAADAVSATAHLPIDSLFWCAGAQGSMYPLTGNAGEMEGGAQMSTLMVERMAFKMHREGLVWDSVGENSPAICSTYLNPILPKSRYRYQMVNPIATTDGCYPFGHTTATWDAGHQYPYTGEDFGYIVWKKRNCCVL